MPKTAHNYKIIQNSKNAACLYCLEIFPARDVVLWQPDSPPTAQCPRCELDFVVGDFEVNIEQLIEKEKYNRKKGSKY